MQLVPTLRECPNATKGANDTNNHALTFRPMVDQHNSATPYRKEAIQVPHFYNLLLHKMGGSCQQ